MTNSRFSAVQLTLLSVIVALILESLLNQFGDPVAGWHTWLPWFQATVIAITVITIWSGFALILTVSVRRPELCDFVYPFGLLITLTLAANSLGESNLARYFSFLALSNVFACWALYAELRSISDNGQTAGVRQALYVQAVDLALSLLMALIVVASSPPIPVINFALTIAIAMQAFSAVGTMRGWRYVAGETSASGE